MYLPPDRPFPSSALAGEADERLAALVLSGRTEAFEAIVVRHRRGLVRHCSRLVGASDAEEAVQEALLKAYNALRAGAQVRNVEPWLRTIAHNTSVNMLRSKTARPTADEDSCVCNLRTDQSAEHRDDALAILELVGQLPTRQRDAIVMRELEGRSYEEIADRLGATHGAVRQLLSRARTSIRQRLLGLPLFEPLARWLGSGGVEAAQVGAASGSCAAAVKVCAALLPVIAGVVGAASLGVGYRDVHGASAQPAAKVSSRAAEAGSAAAISPTAAVRVAVATLGSASSRVSSATSTPTVSQASSSGSSASSSQFASSLGGTTSADSSLGTAGQPWTSAHTTAQGGWSQGPGGGVRGSSGGGPGPQQTQAQFEGTHQTGGQERGQPLGGSQPKSGPRLQARASSQRARPAG